MSRPVNIAVIGVGYLGRIHAKIYHGLSQVNLVAVVDSDRAVADEIGGQYNCASLNSASDLLDQDAGLSIDAVSVVVPTSAHLPVSRPFLARGIHMLLEKPVAPTVAESRKIVELAEENNVILQIGHLERFNAGVMKLVEMASNPRFIEVHRLGKFAGRATDVDVVTDLMIHDIDIVLSLVPSTLKSVSAMGASVITSHVDIANARLAFANGTVANVTASRVSRNQVRHIRLFSQDHYLKLDFTDQQLEEVKSVYRDSDAEFPEIIDRKIDVQPQLPLNAELAHFVQCVQEKKAPLVDGQAGLTAVEVAEMVKHEITQSMKSQL